MGQDKALLSLHGETLIERALKTLRLLSGPPPQIAAPRPDLAAYAPILPDLHPNCGPLSGIEAALAATTHPLNLFLPVDLPLLPAPFLRCLIHRAQTTGAMVTIPRLNGRPQPLCAIYHRVLLPSISQSLQTGNYKVLPAVLTAASQFPQSIDLFDTESLVSINPTLSQHPPHRWFLNCNTPSDLAMIGLLLTP